MYDLFSGIDEPTQRYTTIYHYLLCADRENAFVTTSGDAVELSRAKNRWLRSWLERRRQEALQNQARSTEER